MTTTTQTTNTTIQTPITKFSELALTEPLMQAVKDAGYETPTPIQAQAIPYLLAGRDLLGLAQTGTGKTAAFVLPLLQRLMADRKRALPKSTRALILTPTRELAVQISDSIRTYGRHLPIRSTLIFGGVGQNPQVNTMRKGIDIVVATPGRLLDLINQRHVTMDSVDVFILDEGDRMLDMGFIRDIRKIVALLPAKRQTLMFSATMPNDVADLAKGLLSNPVRVEVVPQATTAERIEQRLFFVDKAKKRNLISHLLADPKMTRAIVFTRTKHGADRLTEQLEKDGFQAAAIHGNKGQGARQQALNSFRKGSIKVLVATDIAARGIDVDDISHVVNYDLPMEPESYVHRIGRTARAGAAGIAYSLCDREERGLLRDIERVIRNKLQVVTDHPFAPQPGEPAHVSDVDGRAFRSRNMGRGGGDQANNGHGRGDRRPGPQRPGQNARKRDRDEQPRGGEARPQEHRGTEHRVGEHRGGEHRTHEHRSHDPKARDGQGRDGQPRQQRDGQGRDAHARDGQKRSFGGGKPGGGRGHRGQGGGHAGGQRRDGGQRQG